MAIFDRPEDEPVLKIFEEITRIPRHSGKEEGIGEYVRSHYNKDIHKIMTDDWGNILVSLPASEGYENDKPIIIHSRLDMIYEQDSDSERDLTKDELDLIKAGDRLYAEGSSLGASSAVGLAMMISLMDDPSLVHPKLQLLFTARTYPEAEGAKKYDTSLLFSGRAAFITLTGVKEGVFPYEGGSDAGEIISSMKKDAESFGMDTDIDPCIMGFDITDPDTPGEWVRISSVTDMYHEVFVKLIAIRRAL